MKKTFQHAFLRGAFAFALACLGFASASPLQAGTCTISSSGTYTQSDLETCAGGSLTGLVVDAGATLTLDGAVVVSGDVSIDGILTHAGEDTDGVDITANNLSISATGSINVDAKGCFGGNPGYYPSFGPNNTTGACEAYGQGSGSGSATGGCHGGLGGRSTWTTSGCSTYGDSQSPSLLGAGGAGGDHYGDVAGNGGGRIRLEIAGALNIEGNLSADGGTVTTYGSWGAGGGAGGSIDLHASTLSGSGSIHADGGDGLRPGGGGGGGRIAIYYDSIADGSTLLANASAAGGLHGEFADSADGSPGSLYTALHPNLSISEPSLSLEENSSAIFTLALTTQPSSDVMINLSSSNQAAATVSPSSLTFTSSNWNLPQTLTVQATDNNSSDGNTSLNISITSASGDPDYDGLTDSVAVTITDDDPGGGSGSPSLHLDIQGPTQELEIGDNADYSITASNSGDADAEQVVLTITLPESLHFLSADVQASDASLANASASATCSAQGQSVVCALGSLAPASSMTVWLSARVVQGGSLELQAVLQSENGGSAEASGGSGSQAIASDLQGSCALQKGPSRPHAGWIFAILLLSPLLLRIRVPEKKW